jgi:hypothetical protein
VGTKHAKLKAEHEALLEELKRKEAEQKLLGRESSSLDTEDLEESRKAEKKREAQVQS